MHARPPFQRDKAQFITNARNYGLPTKPVWKQSSKAPLSHSGDRKLRARHRPALVWLRDSPLPDAQVATLCHALSEPGKLPDGADGAVAVAAAGGGGLR